MLLCSTSCTNPCLFNTKVPLSNTKSLVGRVVWKFFKFWHKNLVVLYKSFNLHFCLYLYHAANVCSTYLFIYYKIHFPKSTIFILEKPDSNTLSEPLNHHCREEKFIILFLLCFFEPRIKTFRTHEFEHINTNIFLV